MSKALIHATNDLVRSMDGLAPTDSRMNEDWPDPACTQKKYLTNNTVWTFTERIMSEHRTQDDVWPVTCSRCLRRMFDAIEPVRRDYLLEHGLIDDPTI